MSRSPESNPKPHQPHPTCWCSPVEIEPGVWVHRDHPNVPTPDRTQVIGWHCRGKDIDMHCIAAR